MIKLLVFFFIFGVLYQTAMANLVPKEKPEENPWYGMYATTELPTTLGIPASEIDGYIGMTFGSSNQCFVTLSEEIYWVTNYNLSYIMDSDHEASIFLWYDKPWESKLHKVLPAKFSDNYDSVLFLGHTLMKRTSDHEGPGSVTLNTD